MSTKIEWTDEVWNPVRGCTKVSPACEHCYAERMHKRHQGVKGMERYHHPFNEVHCHPDLLDTPRRWKKPRRIFVNSMSDTFHDDVPDVFIQSMFSVMAAHPQHTFQLLTKRPERALTWLTKWYKWFSDNFPGIKNRPLPNVWIGVTVWDQPSLDNAMRYLLPIPAAKRFISYEPALGPVKLGLATPCDKNCNEYNYAECPGTSGLCIMQRRLDWVICGGETGPGARPMHPGWVRSVRDQCVEAGVPFFFKGWGEWLQDDFDTVTKTGCAPKALFVRKDGVCNYRGGAPEHCETLRMMRVGKKAAGRVLDGRTWEEFPR